MNGRYSNWIFFMAAPIAFYLLVELLFGWPAGELLPQFRQGYRQAHTTLIGIFLVAAALGMAINYRHFKKLPAERRRRRSHIILSVLLIAVNYLVSKLLIFGSTLTTAQFYSTTGLRSANFRLLEKLSSSLLLLYFLWQVFFAVTMVKRQRSGQDSQDSSNQKSRA